jgi:hypothetical protein
MTSKLQFQLGCPPSSSFNAVKWYCNHPEELINVTDKALKEMAQLVISGTQARA